MSCWSALLKSVPKLELAFLAAVGVFSVAYCLPKDSYRDDGLLPKGRFLKGVLCGKMAKNTPFSSSQL